MGDKGEKGGRARIWKKGREDFVAKGESLDSKINYVREKHIDKPPLRKPFKERERLGWK